MQKILSIFGTRPEAIKMAPVVKELKKYRDVTSVVCVTAQHRGMLDQVLKVFGIVPDYDLDIMCPNQTLSHITSAVLTGVEEILAKERPDIVLVHGDTTTAMASALAAFYQKIPVGHIEAGLRTYNLDSPFPEELNRQVIDRIAAFLFAPTKVSAKHLKKDLNQNQKIFITGNTAIDALKTTVSDQYSHANLDWAQDSRLILLTAHRRENLGEPMRNIFIAIRRLLEEFSDVKVIYPVHLNPKVQSVARETLGNNDRVRLVDPLDVLDFHNFMKRAFFIMSDSGGVQEEAPSLGKPVLVLRDTTERPEGVEAGTLKLVGTQTKDVYNAGKELLTNESVYQQMSNATNPYGDGTASRKIINALLREQKHSKA